jgi:hypothetical protein
MMVNLAEGLGAFSGLDAGNLAALALAIPAFGVGMLAFFGLKGIGGLVESFTGGMKGIMDWIFGNDKSGKTPMQQLASDLQLFQNINGDNLSKVGQGFKDLASGLLDFARISEKDLEKASKAAAAAAQMSKSIPGATTSSSTTAAAGDPRFGTRDDPRQGRGFNRAPASTAPAPPKANEGRRQPLPATTSSTAPGAAPPIRDMRAYQSRAGVRNSSGAAPKAPASTKPTPASSSELGGIDYASYAKTMGQRESSGDYKKVNTLGFVGKYQFGSMALEDLKLVKSGVGAKGNSALDDPSNWTIDGGKEAFLNNSSLQEKAMVDYTKMMFKRIKKLKVIDDTTPPATIAGYLGAAHIGGQGGAADLKAGIVRQDAYGTKTSDYFKLASSTQGTSSSSTQMAAASPPKVSGAQIAAASTAVDSGRRQAMAPASTTPVSTNAATPKTRGPQAQQITIPNTVDSDLFDALIARATEFS